MKKILFSMLAVLAIICANTSAYAADSGSASTVNRKMYGYFNYNGALAGAYGFCSLNLNDLSKADVIYPYGNMKSIYSGAAVDDVFYAYEYVYDSFMGPQNGDFISYNITTGRYTVLGSEGLAAQGTNFKTQDMTYDYSSKTMYAIGFYQGESALYSVNLKDGMLTKVTTLQKTLGVIAADMDGTLYGVGANDGVLYKVNKNDGSLTRVLQTGFGGLSQNQTMEFDHSTGLLYWAACSYDYDKGIQAHMLCIDLTSENVTMKNLGQIGINSSFMALYIPFAEGGDNAPAEPAEFTVTPGEKGAKTAHMTWKAPTTSFGGETLADAVTGYVIERNGEKIATLEANATSYDDTSIDADGDYAYVIYAVNKAGNGGKARATVFVGNDMPGQVSNMKFIVGEGCASAKLSWDAPTQGFNGGYFSPDGLTYKIVRQPDNKTVVENLKETTFTDDQMTRIGRYTYVIYACNEYGETAANMPEAYVLGKAMTLPMSQDFSNMTYFENQWMAYDANKDAYSWTYTSEWGPLQFDDTTPCAEYIVNPGIENYGNDADEWLISPPLEFNAAKSYKIRVKIRCTAEEKLQFTLGSNNIYTEHAMFDEFTFKPQLNESGDNWIYSEYEFNVPAGTDGARCIGIHLVSPYPVNEMSYLQIANVTVEEGVASGIKQTINSDEAKNDNDIYTIDGRLVRTDGNLKGLTKGIYIKGGKKYVIR